MTVPSQPSVRHPWRLRDLLRKLHLWLGLSVGLAFAVLALSGTVLAFQTDLLRWRHPELFGHALPTPAQRAAILERIHDAHWPAPLRSIDTPTAELPVWQLSLAGEKRVYLDPADGHELLTRSKDHDLVLWLRDLHTHLLSGKNGETALGILGLAELSLILIGLTLWWPRRGHWRHAVRMYAQPPTRRWRSWHQSVGAMLFPLLLLSTLTGITLIYKDTTRTCSPPHSATGKVRLLRRGRCRRVTCRCNGPPRWPPHRPCCPTRNCAASPCPTKRTPRSPSVRADRANGTPSAAAWW